MSIALRPRRDAVLLALGYFVLTATWIQFSSLIAAKLATSIEELAVIERYKGLGFMAVSSIALYFAALWVFRRNIKTAELLLQSRQRLVQAEREAVSGLLASTVAHDINNMMTIQRLSLEKLKTSPGLPEVAKDSISRLDRASERMTDIVTRLRNVGRNVFRESPRAFDVAAAVADTISLMRTHAGSQHCEIEFLAPADKLVLRGYPVLIHQLVMNLVLNAAEACGGHGRIRVELGAHENGIKICVSDNGPGVEGAARDSIFEAFFTTKTTGSGLGLTSVRSAVDIHGGKIEVGRSPDLGGARFSVELPHLDHRPTELLASDRDQKPRFS